MLINLNQSLILTTIIALVYIVIAILMDKSGYRNALYGIFYKIIPKKEKKPTVMVKKLDTEEPVPFVVTNHSHRCINIHTSSKHIITIKPRKSIHTVLRTIDRKPLSISVGIPVVNDRKIIEENTITWFDGIEITDSEVLAETFEINGHKLIPRKQRTIKIISDPYWFVRIKYNENLVYKAASPLSFSAVNFDDGDIKDPYLYVTGISHILTPYGKIIDFRNATEGTTSDNFKFVVIRTAFNHVDVVISRSDISAN
jgi:hypothetical protein